MEYIKAYPNKIDKKVKTVLNMTGYRDDKIKKLSEGERLAKKYPCIKVDSAGLKKRNPDYAGWIYVPGTDISYPVVIGKEGDPYLHKAFDGSYSYSGTIFFDKRNGSLSII